MFESIRVLQKLGTRTVPPTFLHAYNPLICGWESENGGGGRCEVQRQGKSTWERGGGRKEGLVRFSIG